MKYQPISCSLYDSIEAYAVKKKMVSIIYSTANDNQTVVGKIENIYSKDRAEYLRVGQTEIRLDRIITVKENLDL